MAKEDTSELFTFLEAVSPEAQDKALWLRDFVWDRYPQCNEMIYDNYNALAIGWSPTEKMSHIFCSVAIYRTNNGIHFGFYWGSQIPDPQHMLLGEGKQYRYIRVDNLVAFPETYMKQLMQDAYELSLSKVKDPKLLLVQGKTFVKGDGSGKKRVK
ncbi:hypothetical protein HQ865_12865 [Mucilaginibacter mali]|uniref:YdhG-like domain-containing protein n=1 Tax=Mucilaginibacter mali TaxID=2740462 RepID=A0A7D4QKL8_9SPHI|nr:hypothetical protein [Mucilaginibacter mali]QKJ30610.1 hypothetical protein HQ865_12865 [Mucilaginibacter mali]